MAHSLQLRAGGAAWHFTLNSEINDSADDGTAADRSAYRISSDPVVGVSSSNDERTETASLPRSYGTGSLHLIARDPRTLYAYWDIDWTAVFDEPAPRERKVHLRVLNADGSQETGLEVEPMSGSCLIELSREDGRYHAELGYEQLGEWKPVSTSAAVTTPPAGVTDHGEGDLATIPFHVSFQRMLEVLGSPQESGSLTAMLAALRERAASDSAGDFHTEERKLVETIDDLIAHAPPAAGEFAHVAELWRPERLERMLGFGSSSPLADRGGGSRSS